MEELINEIDRIKRKIEKQNIVIGILTGIIIILIIVLLVYEHMRI